MYLEEKIIPKIDKQSKEKIISLKEIILRDNGILIDSHRLLYDGLCAMENNLFFASSSIFYVFLEKYLRDMLIKNESKKSKLNFTEKDLLNELNEIEKRIEDEQNGYSVKYNFNKICEELKNEKILKEDDFKYLKELYSKFRNPIQHGIYQRLSRQVGLDGLISCNKIEIKDIDNIEDFEKLLYQKPNYNFNEAGLFMRGFILPDIMKTESIKMLDLIYNLFNLSYGKN